MITPDQIKAARKLLGWSSATLAKRANRKLLTVARVEAGTLPPCYLQTTALAIRAAFDAAGVEFVNGGVRLSEGRLSEPTSITAAQLREARRLLGWSIYTLSVKAGLGTETIMKAEKSALALRNAERQLAAIRRTLGGAGIEFTNDGQPGVRMKKEGDGITILA
jgi:ribosome-binding protein aMBF1 (putative translation factor)